MTTDNLTLYFEQIVTKSPCIVSDHNTLYTVSVKCTSIESLSQQEEFQTSGCGRHSIYVCELDQEVKVSKENTGSFLPIFFRVCQQIWYDPKYQ